MTYVKLVLEFLWKYKQTVGVVILVLCVFFIGRVSKSQGGDNTLNRTTYQLDSIRKVLREDKIQDFREARHRDSLEKLYRNHLRKYDSLRLTDQLVIKKYINLLGKKQTPHEIQLEMDSIYNASRMQR